MTETIPTLDDLREHMRRAGIDPLEPLGASMLMLARMTGQAAALVAGARGISPEGEAELIRRLCDRISLDNRASVRAVSASLRMRSIIVLACCLGGCIGIGAGVGYFAGRDIEQRSVYLTQTGLSEVFAQQPEAAQIALRLLQTTNLVRAWEVCQANATQQQGRGACALPIWTSPPSDSPAPPLK